MAESPERRQAERLRVFGRARIDDGLLAYVRDLSEGGARLSVITDDPLTPGQSYVARVCLFEADPVELECGVSVVWTERVGVFYDVGVRFEGPMQDALVEALSRLERTGGERRGEEPIRGVRVELLPNPES